MTVQHKYSLTLLSRNRKTGPIPTSVSTGKTCPTACPFRKNGCYADGGPLAMHWRAVTHGERGTSWARFCEAVAKIPAGTIWRHNVAGDLPGEANKIDAAQLKQLVDANKGKAGFTYTHKPMTAGNLRAVKAAVAAGFTINLSANSPAHADRLMHHGLPVATVVDSKQLHNMHTPAGHKIVICPAVTRDNVTCAKCGLCAVAHRQVIIGFPAHGSGAAKINNHVRREA